VRAKRESETYKRTERGREKERVRDRKRQKKRAQISLGIHLCWQQSVLKPSRQRKRKREER
jgi:hypothetical protein